MSLTPDKYQQWPFNVRRIPIFYGWVVLVVGTLGMMAAVPGSPPGLSVFIDPMLAELRLSRDRFSLAYTIGTVMAGIVAPFAGWTVDRYGARVVAAITFSGLGLMLIFTAFVPHIHKLLGDTAINGASGFLLVLIAFGGMRVMGVAFGMTACRTMIFRWFTERRNLAAIINGIVLSLSFSSAPVLLNLIANRVGTQATWLMLGLLFAVGMTLLALIFFRESPEACGLSIEKATHTKNNHDTDIPEHLAFTARQALCTATFWAINLAIATHAVIGTGSAFHIVSLAAENDIFRDAALKLFLPISLVNIASTLFFGWYSRRCPVRFLVLMLVAAQALTLLGLFYFGTPFGKISFIIGSGIGWGIFGILINVPWPRFFGRKHLGAINGYVSGITILTSGLGPYLFGLSKATTGSFDAAIVLCIALTPICLLAALIVHNPLQRSIPAIE
jgi:OFA family oxalate/formate antiporter-like MFS transporter